MKIKAVGMISGGLDSILATKMMVEMGIEVFGFNTKTPFCLCSQHSGGCGDAAKICHDLGISFKMMSITEEFLEVLINPKYGYGSNMNPCIDCRVLLFKKAKEYMDEVGAQFMFTGEVVGQRPKSQFIPTLRQIDKAAGVAGLVLRPLSAQLLDPTIPEKEGWLDRDQLLSISGRSRKPQFKLAEELNVKDYPCSAGGCLLTDPNFAGHLKDLFDHGVYDLNSIQLIKAGRQFRFSPKTKITIGRHEKDNRIIANLAKEDDVLLEVIDYFGPLTIVRGDCEEEAILQAAQYTKRYSDIRDGVEIEVKAYKPDGSYTKIFKI